MERTDIRMAELLEVPFRLPEQLKSPKEARKLVAAVVKKVDAFFQTGRPVLSDRQDAVRRLQADCDEHLYEYFDIIDVERALIEDTEQVVIESILPKRASATLPTLKEATTDYRRRYVDMLCRTLNDWTREGPYRIHGRTYASSTSGVATVILDRTRNGPPPAGAENDGAALMTVLDNLQRTFAKELGSIELLRGVKVFDKETLYLFKPLAQRFWTRTAALNDADDIAATILMRSRKERA